MSKTRPSDETIRRGHETRDVDSRKIFWFTVSFLIFAIITHIGIRLVQLAMERSEPGSVAAETPTVKTRGEWPQPTLEVSRLGDLREFRLQQEAVLHSYDWIDKKEGVLRVPVERAMDLILQESGRGDGEKQGGAR